MKGKQHVIAFVMAHPDDETFGAACLIRRLADAGHRVALLLATRGEAGKSGRLGPMSREELAAVRDREMRRAAEIMGVARIRQLGHPDSGLAGVDSALLAGEVADFLNEEQAEVVMAFPEDGMNYHPDHVAIHHAAKSAVFGGNCPSVRKLYYFFSNTYRDAGHSPSVLVDVADLWEMKAEALRSHESQILSIERIFGDMRTWPEDRRHERFILAWAWGSPQKGAAESDLLEGLQP